MFVGDLISLEWNCIAKGPPELHEKVVGRPCIYMEVSILDTGTHNFQSWEGTPVSSPGNRVREHMVP